MKDCTALPPVRTARHPLFWRPALAMLALALGACETQAPQPQAQFKLPDHAEVTLPEADDLHDEVRIDVPGMVAGWSRQGDWLVSPPLEVQSGAQRVGALIDVAVGAQAPLVQAQILKDDAVLSVWKPLSQTWSEGRLQVAVAQFGAAGTAAQLRMPADQIERIERLQWLATIPEAPQGSATAPGAFAEQQGALSSPLSALGIVSRAQWQARATKCSTADKAKYRLAIHHTETTSVNPAQRVRAIQAYHMDTRGWCDIGYHFLVGTDGSIYEGRPYQLLGSHTGGNNTGNIGISFIGCFNSKGCEAMAPQVPPAAMLESAGRLMGSLSKIEGIALSSATVKGHGDHPGANTICPGDQLSSRLGLLIATGKVADLQSGPLAAPVAPAPKPAPTPAPAPAPAPQPKANACADLSCGACQPSAGCQWCAASESCGDSKDYCAWQGYVDTEVCWAALWPCAVGSCWNPSQAVPVCSSAQILEDFSSGSFNVHRYWTKLPAGAPITLRLERLAGTWSPALLLADHAGQLASGGQLADLHPDLQVLSVKSGRGADVAEVTLQATKNYAGFIYVTGWPVLDAGFHGKLPTSAKYRLTLAQSCGK